MVSGYFTNYLKQRHPVSQEVDNTFNVSLGHEDNTMYRMHRELNKSLSDGSSRNSSPTLDQEIPADICFVNDRSTNRLQKNARLFSSLMSCGKLHVSRGNLNDLIVTCSRI